MTRTCHGADRFNFGFGEPCSRPGDVIHDGVPLCEDCLLTVFPDIEFQGYPTANMFGNRHRHTPVSIW